MKRLTAALTMFVLLCGCSNFQFSNIPSQVEKPEGEYEKAKAVADYDDLMPVEEGVYTFDDGATVDKWAVDPQYYGEKGEPSAELYALSTGELLLKVLRPSRSGFNTDLFEEDAWAAVEAYLDAHPVYDLEKQLRKAYARFASAVKSNVDFEYRTIDTDHAVNGQVQPYDVDGELHWYYADEVIHVTTTVEDYYWRQQKKGPDGEMHVVRAWIYDPKRDRKEIARIYREFDAKTGDFIKEQ